MPPIVEGVPRAFHTVSILQQKGDMPPMSAQSQHAWLTAGDRLDRFTIQTMLGKGENAQVYRAFHPGYKRDVAIKVLHPDITRTESLTPIFQSQAAQVIALKHPNVVRILEAGISGDSYYIVMELIEGVTLRDEVSAHPRGFERGEALHIFHQIASAVAYAHEQHILHGNIKPDNVLIDRKNRPVLTDFNIPCFREHPSGRGGAATPIYLAPEQIEHKTISAQSDIYSMGILLYEMVTGDIPFKGKNHDTIRLQHLSAEPTPPSKIAVGLDPRIENTILTALKKDPTARFASVRDMLAGLENDADGNPYETVSLKREEVTKPSKRPSEIRRFERSRASITGEQIPVPAPLAAMPRAIIFGLVVLIVLVIVALLIIAI